MKSLFKIRMQIELVILLFILFVIPVLQAEKNKIEWSPFQGISNWRDAKLKCKKMKMRLPTVDEVSITTNKYNPLWWVEGFYWTSDYCSEDKKWVCMYSLEKQKDKLEFLGISGASEDERLFVRCVR